MDKTESVGHDGASTMVRLPAARKKGGAGTSFAEMLEELRRRQMHDRAAAMATGKQRRRAAKNGDGEVLIERLRSKEKATQGPFLRQREAKGGHRRVWKQKENRRR